MPGDNPIRKAVREMLGAGHPGPDVAAELLAAAGDLAAAFTRSEAEARALAADLSRHIVDHAGKAATGINARSH